jgi:hypothetical protein
MGGRRGLGLFLFRLLGFAFPRCCLLGGLQATGMRYGMSLASDNRRSEDVLILPIIIAELELSNIDWSVFGVHLAEN